MPGKTDETYMLEVQSGELSSMAELFERYQSPIYNYLRKVIADEIVSEDLTQQLFVRALRYRMSYRPADGTVKTWLYRMATNLANDHRRHQARYREHNLELTEMHTFYTGAEPLFAETDYRMLEQALQQLEEEQRQLLVLSKYQGMRYEEIAGILGISVSNVKVKVHRAILQLRKTYFKQAI